MSKDLIIRTPYNFFCKGSWVHIVFSRKITANPISVDVMSFRSEDIMSRAGGTGVKLVKELVSINAVSNLNLSKKCLSIRTRRDLFSVDLNTALQRALLGYLDLSLDIL